MTYSDTEPRGTLRYRLLAASMRPTDFTNQLNVSLANGWGIVRTVTDLCMKMPEGKYVLIKDPNKVSTFTNLFKLSIVLRAPSQALAILPSLRFVQLRCDMHPGCASRLSLYFPSS